METANLITTEELESLVAGDRLTLRTAAGQVRRGKVSWTHGNGWILDDETAEVVIFAGVCAEQVEAIEIEHTGAAAAVAREDRKYGAPAYAKEPTTRDEFEAVLWDLAAQFRDLQDRDGFDLATSQRAMQIEAQFNRVADRIELAKTKRRYLMAQARRYRAGKPLQNPADFIDGINERAAFEPAKPSDFHPDRAVRKQRSDRPAIAYDTRAQVEWSLNDALARLAGKISPRRRAMFEAIVAKRRRELERGQYREAMEAKQAAATPEPTPAIGVRVISKDSPRPAPGSMQIRSIDLDEDFEAVISSDGAWQLDELSTKTSRTSARWTWRRSSDYSTRGLFLSAAAAIEHAIAVDGLEIYSATREAAKPLVKRWDSALIHRLRHHTAAAASAAQVVPVAAPVAPVVEVKKEVIAEVIALPAATAARDLGRLRAHRGLDRAQALAYGRGMKKRTRKNPAAVALGRLGGQAGKGAAKARSSEQARAAVLARWERVRAAKAAQLAKAAAQVADR